MTSKTENSWLEELTSLLLLLNDPPRPESAYFLSVPLPPSRLESSSFSVQLVRQLELVRFSVVLLPLKPDSACLHIAAEDVV